MTPKLPLRPQQHQTGDAATRAFENSVPDRWVLNPARSDYGWDYIVTLAAVETGEVQDEFYAQVKGSLSSAYSSDRTYVSQSLELSAINWLRRRPIPVLIAVCDVDDAHRPLFWAWLPDVIEELGKRNSNWESQETATLRIPTSQQLRADDERIEQYVRHWHQELRLSRAVTDVLLPAATRATLVPKPEAIEIDESYVRTTVLPTIQGLHVSTAEVNKGPVDSRRGTLERVSALLNAYQDAEATRLLRELAAEVESASEDIRAAYENSIGIVALHDSRLAEARDRFLVAASLDAGEPKYAVNVLITEHVLSQTSSFPEDWKRRLENVLATHPAFVPALTLNVRVVGSESGLAAAAALFNAAPVTKPADRRRLLLALADVAASRDALDEALRYLAEAEALEQAADADLLSLKGYVLFRKATRGSGASESAVRFEGLGPSDMDLRLLRQAADTYDQACVALAKAGYPLIGEDTFYNAATVLVVDQRPEQAERHVQAFLQQNPRSTKTRAALALVLTHLEDDTHAVPHAIAAFEASKEPGEFKNLLLALLHAEEFEELVGRFHERERTGFADDSEKTLSLELAAAAFAAIGDHTQASRCLEQLRELGRHAEAVATEALIALRSGADKTEIASLARAALRQYPGHPLLLTMMVRALVPVTAENAAEVAAGVEQLARHRQLALEEAVALARAYVAQARLADAEQVLRAARERFARKHDLLVEHAELLYELGREEEALLALQEFLKAGRKSYAAYRNLGQLSWLTGRLDDAIRLFEMALARATEPAERAELHCQLFELLRRRGDTGKARLRHAVRYGDLAQKEPESEARYLMMFMLTPISEGEHEDSEIKGWIAQFQRRLSAFSAAHPRFHSLTTIKVPEGASDEERGRQLVSEMMAVVLPGQILRGQVEMRIRAGAWPLTTRAQWLQAISPFVYWDRCIRSDEHAHAVHIFTAPLDLESEIPSISFDNPVCVDITTLLTLHTLDLLDDVAGLFPYWVIAANTREALESESLASNEGHPTAAVMRSWLIANRHRIRTRRASALRRNSNRSEDRFVFCDGLWVRQEPTIEDVVGSGVGETLLLASELKLLLYSDEALVRLWARDDHQVQAFSTLALLRFLRRQNRVTLESETTLLARMAALNFRYVPFAAEHLREGLRLLRQQVSKPTSHHMNSHGVLGPLLLQFGDLALTDVSLAKVSTELYVDLLHDASLDDDVIGELVATVSFRMSQRVSNGILSGVSRDKPVNRLAVLWAFLLSATYDSDKALVPRCWSILRRAAEKLFPNDEKTFWAILTETMPLAFYRAIIRRMPPHDAVLRLVELPQGIPVPERGLWEHKLFEWARRDRLVH